MAILFLVFLLLSSYRNMVSSAESEESLDRANDNSKNGSWMLGPPDKVDWEMTRQKQLRWLCATWADMEGQRAMCMEDLDTFLEMRLGGALALSDCRVRFRFSRWNCSRIVHAPPYSNINFWINHTSMTKEAGYVQAMRAASMAQRIITRCFTAKQLIPSCVKKGRGFAFAERSLRRLFSSEKRVDGRAAVLVQRHNQIAGFQAIRSAQLNLCKQREELRNFSVAKCLRIVLPPVRFILDQVEREYENAKKVRMTNKDATILTIEDGGSGPARTDIVYLEDSMSEQEFCAGGHSTGHRCLIGHRALKDPEGSCKELCCNKGYTLVQQKFDDLCLDNDCDEVKRYGLCK